MATGLLAYDLSSDCSEAFVWLVITSVMGLVTRPRQLLTCESMGSDIIYVPGVVLARGSENKAWATCRRRNTRPPSTGVENFEVESPVKNLI